MKPLLLTLCASALLVGGARSHEAEYHVGQWIGTWQDGEASGRFDLDLERASDGQIAGNVDVSMSGGKTREYAVDLRHINFNGDHFTAVFITPGKTAEVKLSGTLEKEKGSGEWVASKRVDSTASSAIESTSGTWELQKYDN
jgi:hypothetical protein